MEPITLSVPSEPVLGSKRVARAPACPLCTAPLIELRSFWRCPRCYYLICAGCDVEIRQD
jgi:hypothetical protein